MPWELFDETCCSYLGVPIWDSQYEQHVSYPNISNSIGLGNPGAGAGSYQHLYDPSQNFCPRKRTPVSLSIFHIRFAVKQQALALHSSTGWRAYDRLKETVPSERLEAQCQRQEMEIGRTELHRTGAS